MHFKIKFDLMSRVAGFTLVELLVATSLMSLVGGAVIATFAGGLQVWERVQCQGTQSESVLLAFYDMKHNFIEAQQFDPISFRGRTHEYSFPALVSTETESGLSTQEIGRVGYYLDKKRGYLCRSEHPYRTLKGKRLRQTCTPIAEHVDRLQFKYYVLDATEESYSWTRSFKSEVAPLSFQVELNYHDQCTEKGTKKTLVVTRPTGA
jgi:type II secretory pathway component PulJ